MSGLEDLTQAVATVTGVLETHRVPYFVTGSLASSAHAEFRARNDIDLSRWARELQVEDLLDRFFGRDPDQG